MKQHDSHEDWGKLGDLLGQAPLVEPDAWFAARTLARARREESARGAFWKRVRWAFSGALTASVILCATLWQTGVLEDSQTVQTHAALNYLADHGADVESWNSLE